MLFSFSKEVTFTETVLSDSLLEFKSSIPPSRLKSSLRVYLTALAVVILSLFAATASPWISPGTKRVLVGVTVAVTGAFAMWCRAQVVVESVLLVRDLGAQVRVRFWAGSESTAFMPKDMVEGVFIHEYIAGSRVHFSLAFILKGPATSATLILLSFFR
jgi:hypothetical protein